MMTNPATIVVLLFSIPCLLLVVPNANVYAAEQGPIRNRAGNDIFERIRVFVHDLRIGHVTPTVFEVGKAYVTDNSPVSFGSVHVLDDLLTEGPDIKSKPVGRIQGLTTNADMSVFGIAMNLNFFFTTGKYNGSTLSILGRNQVMDDKREMPIAGGSGLFRFASGYAIQTSYSFDQAASYAVLEYNLYVSYNPFLVGVDDTMEIADM